MMGVAAVRVASDAPTLFFLRKISASALQSTPSRRGGAPSDAEPTLRRDAAEAPSSRAPIRNDRSPSGGSPVSIHSRDAGEGRNVRQSVRAGRRAPQYRPAPLPLQE